MTAPSMGCFRMQAVRLEHLTADQLYDIAKAAGPVMGVVTELAARAGCTRALRDVEPRSR